MFRFTVAALLLVGVSACDASYDLRDLRVDDLSQDSGALVGTWDLATRTGSGECTGVCQETVPAAAAQLTDTFTFSADGEYTRSQAWPGGTSDEAARYDVRRVDYGNGTRSDRAVLFLGDRFESFGLKDDRLYIDTRARDGDLREYRRR
ncbi:hypothetical protein [Rubrivirga sp. IMCC45206]|uniref:hypothetical protein n=1 Tax=Rubrivirga sp. IMCC45206 TaxID=3391614 RepID=UPI0039901875